MDPLKPISNGRLFLSGSFSTEVLYLVSFSQVSSMLFKKSKTKTKVAAVVGLLLLALRILICFHKGVIKIIKSIYFYW